VQGATATTTDADASPARPDSPVLTPVPWRPVLAVCAAQATVLMVLAGRYGYHSDELYFRDAAHHLAWGYPDQPPLTPLLVRGSLELLGDHLWSIRVVPALAAAASVVLGALMARELGGGRRAQVLAAVAIALSAYTLGNGHLFTTSTVDLPLWLLLVTVTARMIRTGRPQLWLGFGAVAGVTMLNRHFVVALALGIIVGLAVERRRDLLLSPWLLAGAGVGAVLAAPNLVWQAANGWPQLEMADALSGNNSAARALNLLPAQVYGLGPLLLPLLILGVRHLWRSPGRSRALLWAWLIVLTITLVTTGRAWYPIPATTFLLVAGAVAAEGLAVGRFRAVAAVVVLSGVTVAPGPLPILPVDWFGRTPLERLNPDGADTVGWPQLVAQVADVVGDLPPAERERVVILGATYGDAGAVSRFGPRHGLPAPYSPHNGYWHWRRPTDERAPVVAVTFRRELLTPHFRSCRLAAIIDNGVHVDGQRRGDPIHVCRGLRRPWPATWDALRRYGPGEP
jgi:hypothetical protein